ncbi:hypothetical protein CQW23_06737 [Capsicum baccatum]|uniref:NB-ARC domain-containing protein n=1 Tax=Capsicum baccatum TaxID=33114 RepID=A0A2G2X456_CAPBA|nr:hypothetical protein CQW23_06737 [Capsicum baccatum]
MVIVVTVMIVVIDGGVGGCDVTLLDVSSLRFQVIVTKDKIENTVDMAHASVASLMRTIESLLTSNSPMQSLTCDHRGDFSSLHEKISSLEVVVKNFEKNTISGELTNLEVQVKEVANTVEQTIQLGITEVVLANDENLRVKAHERLSDRLQQVAEEIDRIWKESTKIQDKGKQASKESTVQEFPSSSKDIRNVKNNMVGRDDQRKRLVEDLTRSYSGEPKVIPIVGMGGIGKTTLANEVYNDACIRSHFDVCAWATVSQQQNVKEILLSLLRSIKVDKVFTGSEAELADMLQKSLKCKRYLIVLDDIWKSEAWDAMDLMGPDESWSLFKSVAFSSEALPYEFETVGKQIADECHGLPLTIVVVAGLLKSKRAIEDWRSVAKDVKSFVTNDPDERCSRVLGLSYNRLTSDLKACLLHFGIFPEDSDIPVKNLMRKWMAEGFLKLENDLEGEAEKCLQELVDRCLVLVCKKSRDGMKVMSCKVHDLIYDLCQTELQRENIFIMNDIVLGVSKRGNLRLFLPPVHRLLRDHDNDLLKLTRSIFSLHLSFSSRVLKSELIHFKLLKVLELRHIEIDNFPLQILSLIWLSYLLLQCRENLDIPPEICRLWNLQTFIVQEVQTFIVHGPSRIVKITFPEEIWGLMQLRHLKLPRFYLPDCPSGSVDKGRHLDFSNLQTIAYLSSRCCTKEVILGIQNVKKLGIVQDENDYGCFRDAGLFNNLHQLETLSLQYLFNRFFPASAEAFPATLKKLKLKRTFLSWSCLDIIAELPNLEVLKLMADACHGEEWYPNFQGFTRLKLLIIVFTNLKYWKATYDNFPVLESLVLRHCHCLKEIPIEFAEINSLQLIELTGCLPELGESAARIQQEQEDLGNNPVDVRISNPYYRQISSRLLGFCLNLKTLEDLKDVAEDVKSFATDDPDEHRLHVIIAKAYVNILDMAHASVASLMRTIESLLTSNSPMQSLICDHREELCALREKTSSLELVVKNFEENNVCGEITDFEVEVKEVANFDEHTIQLRVTEVVLANDENLREKAHWWLSDSLQQVEEDLGRVNNDSR